MADYVFCHLQLHYWTNRYSSFADFFLEVGFSRGFLYMSLKPKLRWAGRKCTQRLVYYVRKPTKSGAHSALARSADKTHYSLYKGTCHLTARESIFQSFILNTSPFLHLSVFLSFVCTRGDDKDVVFLADQLWCIRALAEKKGNGMSCHILKKAGGAL